MYALENVRENRADSLAEIANRTGKGVALEAYFQNPRMNCDEKDAFMMCTSKKARLLNEEETERLLSRTRSKLVRRMESEKITTLEVLAIQLEIEDEDLSEWRAKMAEIRKKAKAK